MAQPLWMLDTHALSELIRDPRGLVMQHLSDVAPDVVSPRIVVACEWRFGAQRRGSAVLTERVNALPDAMVVQPFDEPADAHYVDIRATLELAGTPIGSHGMLIAAHARSRTLTPVTHKLREFQRVPGLKVEDWLAPSPAK
ncbi:PilT protein domain protein [Methyloversatilis universalis FAM5]|uniref:PilT protein domain protein n=1 Tax=Methyloversatilis universalis (strain ATCC BAA-1314 / DSM 25237 / JCM 13912 / CCUG 52030 / FAM5) TaxID=1000565 RepID=F5RBH7_METUF|nr:PIN domain-containing protein [Methyloversatilis universalis]EGK72148.1 PilT protein domain protein [Methyloversatilis universalis FAM5]